jgi:hypothetical protein
VAEREGKSAKTAEDERNRRKTRKRGHKALRGEARLSEERACRDNRSVYGAVAKSSEVAKVVGTPNSLIVT